MSDAKDIFLRAIECTSSDDRARLIEDACKDNLSLRRRVEALLAAHDDPDSYLEKPAAKFDVTATHDSGGSNLSDSSSSHHGRFLPGTKVAGRYRIVSMLGRGGMGEVYRADDLRLGQTVALKFLPPELAKDAKRLEYFHNEVRLARQIAHPNVCRVYDIGEVDGQHFISMEYIDGEDLKTLLHRIGRVPADKGVQIAQQLCAGLAAAHAKGVLHRDLKPANIMIDGQGQVRITDFGLATFTGEGENVVGMSGTPAYMAPEQLLSARTSIRSDIYSTGAVLYEIFAGRAAHQSESLEELRRFHKDGSRPEDASGIASDIPKSVDLAIKKCLASDPADRPGSLVEVRSLLPGGDALSAMVSAGDMPPPELLAATDGFDGISQRHMLRVLLAACVGLIMFVCIAQSTYSINKVPLRATALLREDAEEILELLQASDERPQYVAHGYSRLRLGGTRPTEDSPPVYWYRSSPSSMVGLSLKPELKISIEAPQWTEPGMGGLQLDRNGKLIWFQHVVASRPLESTAAEPIDWEALLSDDRLPFAWSEMTTVKHEDADFPQQVQFDHLQTWEGVAKSGEKMRVIAATYRGSPTYFDAFALESLSDAKSLFNAGLLIGSVFYGLYAIASVGFGILAWNHHTHRLSDREGAWRLAVIAFACGIAEMIFKPIHYGNFPHELAIFFRGISWSVFSAAFLFAGYSALEPYCRKRMPELMVSWKRLLSGKFNDPRVGRDILFGLTNSVYVMISWCLIAALWPQAEIFENFQLLSGGRQILLHLGPDRTASLSYCFVCFLVFVGVASLTRSRTMAIVTSAVSSGLLQGTICQLPLTSWGLMVLSFVPVAIGLSRFGLLFYVTGAVGAALLGFPVTTNADAFYFQTGLVGPLIFGLLVIFTAATSCGRSLSTFLIPEPRSSKSS